MADTVPNSWYVTCRNCGAADLVEPGHPAVRPRGDGTHEIYDRTALRHSHSAGCQPGEDGNYSLDFSFTVVPPAVAGTAS